MNNRTEPVRTSCVVFFSLVILFSLSSFLAKLKGKKSVDLKEERQIGDWRDEAGWNRVYWFHYFGFFLIYLSDFFNSNFVIKADGKQRRPSLCLAAY